MMTPLNRRAALGGLAALGAMLGAPAVAETLPTAEPKKIATADEIAALEFKPWSEENASLEIAREWRKAVESSLSQIMFAAVILQKTKPELIEVIRRLNKDGIAEDVCDTIRDAHDVFAETVSILQCVEIRMMSAYASALKQDDPEGFADA